MADKPCTIVISESVQKCKVSIMLVLSRRQLEAVAVSADGDVAGMLKVTVLEVKRGRVKLGFEAANGVAVHRWEVWEKIQSVPGSDGPT